jgi:cellulose synthase/poly-beta-1,6-N-acetylglucosamine synthase-like glycosyltransferase
MSLSPPLPATIKPTHHWLGLLLLALPMTILLLTLALSIWQWGWTMGRQTTLALFAWLALLFQWVYGSNRLLQILASLWNTRQSLLSRRLSNRFVPVDSPKIQPISIILWSHNAAEDLVTALKALLALNYPDYEIIVINDGSTDNTLEWLGNEFQLQAVNRAVRRSLPTSDINSIYLSLQHPILTVVDKSYSGRADSLNIGLNIARAPLVCITEPDYVLARDGLLLLAKSFIEQPTITVMSTSLGEMQYENLNPSTLDLASIERKRLFHTSYWKRDTLGFVSTISNTVRLIRKAELLKIGGFVENQTDLSLILRLISHLISQRRAYRICFSPNITYWQREEYREPAAGRYRQWQRNLLESLASNWSTLTSSPTHFKSLMAPLLEGITPLLEGLGLVVILLAVATQAVPSQFLIGYLLSIIAWGLLESLLSIAADELSLRYQHSFSELLSLIISAVVDAVIYRPLSSFWRLGGIF